MSGKRFTYLNRPSSDSTTPGAYPPRPHVLARTSQVGDMESDCGLAYLSLHP